MFRRILQFVGSALVALGAVAACNQALSLISSPSNFGVFSGIAILAVMAAVVVYAITKVLPRIRSTLGLVFVGTMMLFSAGCYTTINPGYSGIKVNKYGSNRGVDDYPALTGVVWYNPLSTSVIEYPTFVQTAVWTRNTQEGAVKNEEISFRSKDGLFITGDISLSYQLDSRKVPSFYVKFRSDDINNFTHGFLRNVARDAFADEASRFSAEELYSTKNEDFLTAVKSRINSQVDSFGVRIDQLGFIGAIRLPDNVVEAINGKVQATQNAITAENLLRQTRAQAEQRVAAARGEADANRELNASLTTQMLEWRRLELQEKAIAKWDGTLPTFTMGGNSNAVPFIQLPSPSSRKEN